MKPDRRRALFEFVFARDEGRCGHCGCAVKRRATGLHRAPDLATLDHVTPRSAGGALNAANVVLSCQACNNARGVMDVDAFRTGLARGAWRSELRS